MPLRQHWSMPRHVGQTNRGSTSPKGPTHGWCVFVLLAGGNVALYKHVAVADCSTLLQSGGGRD